MDELIVITAWDHFLRSESWYLMKNINHIIGATIICTIFFTELYFAIKASKKIRVRDENFKSHTLILLLPLFIYVGNILAIFCGPMADFAPWILSCLLWCQMAIILWLINKCILYLVLIIRIHSIYGNTTFAYNKNRLTVFSILIITETVIMSTLAPMNTTVEIIHFNHIDGVICEMTVSFLFLGIATTVDMIVSFITLYLFLKPLSILQRQQDLFKHELSSTYPTSPSATSHATSMQSDASKSIPDSMANKACRSESTIDYKKKRKKEKKGTHLHKLMTKYSTLTVVMVSSTFFILTIVGLFDTISIGTVDVTVNCICIALFDQRYNKIYKKLCCGGIIVTKFVTEHCCNWGRICSRANSDDVDNITLELPPNSPQSINTKGCEP